MSFSNSGKTIIANTVGEASDPVRLIDILLIGRISMMDKHTPRYEDYSGRGRIVKNADVPIPSGGHGQQYQPTQAFLEPSDPMDD